MTHTALPIKLESKSYIVLSMLSSVYILFLITSSVFINKLISVYGHLTTLSAFFFPMTIILSDIVLEVYGYRIARSLIWTGLFCQFLFAIFATIAIHLAGPDNIYYYHVLNNLIPIYFGALIAAFIADFINIYILSKLKILTRGRYFALRSLGCSIISNLFYTTICCTVIYYHTLPLMDIFRIGLMIYLIKIAFTSIFVYPAAMIATMGKIKARIDVYDYHINFNPFRILEGIRG
jgi:queuosine precursor transporter